MLLEVHAVDAGYQHWGRQDHADDREQIDHLVLLDLDQADRGVEHELHVDRQRRVVLGDGMQVGLDRTQAMLERLAAMLASEHDQPDQALHAIADLARQLVLRAQVLDHSLEPLRAAEQRRLAASASRKGGRMVEDAVAQFVEPSADPLQPLGDPVDGDLEQAREQVIGVRHGDLAGGRVRDERVEGLHGAVAHRHEPSAGADEGERDGRRHGLGGAGTIALR